MSHPGWLVTLTTTLAQVDTAQVAPSVRDLGQADQGRVLVIAAQSNGPFLLRVHRLLAMGRLHVVPLADVTHEVFLDPFLRVNEPTVPLLRCFVVREMLVLYIQVLDYVHKD